MGIPIEKGAWMLGNSSSVITSSTIPSSMLKKRHHALSYHYVRSNVAHGLIKYCKVNTKVNVADVCTKFLPFHEFWPLIQSILFLHGDTADCKWPYYLGKGVTTFTMGIKHLILFVMW